MTCFLRSALMVNDEMPMSYFFPLTPVMIEEKSAGCHSVLTPNFAATALNTSTSKPCTVLPSPARNSLGGVAGVDPDLDHPGVLDALGQLGRQVGVLADRDRRGG